MDKNYDVTNKMINFNEDTFLMKGKDMLLSGNLTHGFMVLKNYFKNLNVL